MWLVTYKKFWTANGLARGGMEHQKGVLYGSFTYIECLHASVIVTSPKSGRPPEFISSTSSSFCLVVARGK
jgi:hypothetical protein